MNEFTKFGYNCTAQGCFNQKKRLDFGHFYDCFPGKNSLTDIDGTIDINGRFLFLEMKDGTKEVGIAQSIYFQRLTALSDRITVICINGDAETMDILRTKIIFHGTIGEWEECDLAQLKAIITDWANWASAPFKAVA